MSRISVDVISARIPVLQVGYQGENEVTDVLFDISSWIAEFGEGVAQLRVKRPGNSEEESYVLSLTITDGIALWTVSETDTFNKGNGKVQLSYLVGNIVKKAVIYPYKVGKSIVGADNPVDPFDSWIERSKAWAIGETLDGVDVPETDETYQNNAKYYAEQADILGSAQVVLATEKATLATEKATLATEKAAAAAESEAAVNGVSTQLTTRMSAIETEQSVQSARMDTFTSLPAGSTSGNAELADIRVGADGTTYDTAGNAVRGQIGELKSDLAELDQVVNGVHKQRTETIVTVETESYTSYYFENPIPAGSTIKTFNVSAHTIYLVKEDGSLNIDFTLPITTTEPYIGISTRSACTAVVEYELNVEEKNGIADELNNIVPKVKEIENVGEIIGGLEIYDNISVNITEGFYAYDLSFRTHSSYVSAVLNVKYGEKYKLTIATPNASGICGCILADDNDSIIETPIMSSTDGEKKYDEELVAIPNGATKMYITSLARVSSIIIKKHVRYLTSDIINLHPLNDKVIVNFGDSIFGNKRTPDDISTQLAEITGATVYNCGFGGCRMSAHNTNWDAFSMYRLAEAIATGDFSVQDAVDVSSVSEMPSYFIETRNLLKSIKWNDVDIITIAYGTNDFTAGVDIDSETNIYDTTTFAGALRYSIEKLLGTYPHLKIFVCGQTYRFWMDSSNVFIDDSDTRTNTNGVKLTDFVQKTKDVSNEYHLKFIDNYYDLGINKHNRSHWFPSNDGTHHNPLGGKLMAEHMANELY